MGMVAAKFESSVSQIGDLWRIYKTSAFAKQKLRALVRLSAYFSPTFLIASGKGLPSWVNQSKK